MVIAFDALRKWYHLFEFRAHVHKPGRWYCRTGVLVEVRDGRLDPFGKAGSGAGLYMAVKHDGGQADAAVASLGMENMRVCEGGGGREDDMVLGDTQ